MSQRGGSTPAVALEREYAYSGVGPRLVVLDGSDPVHPQVVGEPPPLPSIVKDVVVAGGYAYVADWDSGLRIINVSNPAVPTLAGAFDTPGFARGIAVAGGYAYVADYDSGLQIIDVSNPAAPTLAGAFDTPGNAFDVAVAGGDVYGAD